MAFFVVCHTSHSTLSFLQCVSLSLCVCAGPISCAIHSKPLISDEKELNCVLAMIMLLLKINFVKKVYGISSL